MLISTSAKSVCFPIIIDCSCLRRSQVLCGGGGGGQWCAKRTTAHHLHHHTTPGGWRSRPRVGQVRAKEVASKHSLKEKQRFHLFFWNIAIVFHSLNAQRFFRKGSIGDPSTIQTLSYLAGSLSQASMEKDAGNVGSVAYQHWITIVKSKDSW